jgi:hypothetical protein
MKLRGNDMPLGRHEKKLGAVAAAAVAFAMTLAGSPRSAHADGPVTATGKGTVGGALLGGEVVCITMGAIGVERGWPYFVFGGLGAVGGGIGGFFVEKASTPEPSLYMLAGGMALIIPTLVVSLNATAYKPPETDQVQVEPANNKPVLDAPAPGTPATRPTTTSRDVKKRARVAARPVMPHIPLSVLDLYKGHVGLGIPAFELRPLYSAAELWKYGVSQGSEVRLPLFQAMF